VDLVDDVDDCVCAVAAAAVGATAVGAGAVHEEHVDV